MLQLELAPVRPETAQTTSTVVTAAGPGPGITGGPQTGSTNVKLPSGLPGLIRTPGFSSLLDTSTDPSVQKRMNVKDAG